jgi:hypothetical protein
VFTTINLIPIPRGHAERFLRLEQAAEAIYREYGGLGNEILAPVNLEASYGCAAFGAVLDLAADEALYIVLDHFHDRAHYEGVMGQANADARIEALFQEFAQLVDVRRIVRGEFARVDRAPQEQAH